MKKIVFFLFLFSIFGIHSVKASEVPIPVSQINARILPLVWYSTLSINDGDSIKIYSGIQNNSNIDFTGTASFYVDDKNISDVNFTSIKDSLKDISTSWVAVPGFHTIKIKISTTLPSSKELVSYESEESTITIVKKVIEKEKITTSNDETLNNVKETISEVVLAINEVAVPLSEKIKSFKKVEINTNNDNLAISSKSPVEGKPKVLGASTGPENTKKDNTMQSAFNIVLDGLSFLVKNWLWTLVGMIAIFFFFKRKKKK